MSAYTGTPFSVQANAGDLNAEGFNMTNTPHFERPNSRNVNSGTFMILNRIRNTGREGIDERFFRVGLRLGW